MVVKKLIVAAAATAALTGLAACGGSVSVDGKVQSKSSNHDKKGDHYTVTIKDAKGVNKTVTVNKNTFKSCDPGETFSKCRKG